MRARRARPWPRCWVGAGSSCRRTPSAWGRRRRSPDRRPVRHRDQYPPGNVGGAPAHSRQRPQARPDGQRVRLGHVRDLGDARHSDPDGGHYERSPRPPQALVDEPLCPSRAARWSIGPVGTGPKVTLGRCPAHVKGLSARPRESAGALDTVEDYRSSSRLRTASDTRRSGPLLTTAASSAQYWGTRPALSWSHDDCPARSRGSPVGGPA